jgi:CO/xanthine dehydrogenase FAD-binding subunit
MSLFEAYHRDDLLEAWQLDEQLCGNLCRCTGYRPIRDAAFDCLQQRRSNLPDRDRSLLQGLVELPSVAYESTSEVFLRPTTLVELLELMERHPEAQLVAGATDLGLRITKRFEFLATLIALDAIPELTKAQSTDSEWRIGAAVTLTKLWDTIGDEFPTMSSMLRWFGSRQVRNRATLGGNLATASPIADSAPVLLTLDAQVSLRSGNGTRTIPLNEFFIGYRKTVLQPGEIIQEIAIPRTTGGDVSREFARFYKVSRRREMDISTVSGCFRVKVDSTGRVGFARIAYGGVGIAGQSRFRFTWSGKASHAGTTPIHLRKDALLGAARFALQVEAACTRFAGLAATVGELSVAPNISNVVPARVTHSLDIRHQEDEVRSSAIRWLLAEAAQIAEERRLGLERFLVHETCSLKCDPSLTVTLAAAAKSVSGEIAKLPSGAGHDAVVFAGFCPIAMLFVRCRDGLSHHPDEFVSAEDVELALRAASKFVEGLGSQG